MQAILALEDGRIFRGQGYGAQANARAKSFLILPLPAIRKSLPIPPMPGRLSFLPIPKSATTAPTTQTTKSAKPYIEGLIVREFSPSAPTGARSR